jgi:amidase
MLPAADGSDMMGSLRNPAAFNGIVGFRPSQGRVPSLPVADCFYQQLAVNGPMGRSVEDVVRMLCTMAGPDRAFPLGRMDPLPPPEEFRPRPLEGLRIGWLGDFGGHLVTEPGVLGLCADALSELGGAGCVIAEELPAFDPGELWESWLVLRQFGVLRYLPLYEDPAGRAELKPELCWEIEQGLARSALDVARAGAARSRWHDVLTGLFERHDLLALPAAQVFPFPAEEHWPARVGGRAMDTYHRWMEVTIPATLAGAPALSLPVGMDHRGRPMGLQFIGPPGDDRGVLEFALAREAAFPGRVALPSELGGRDA